MINEKITINETKINLKTDIQKHNLNLTIQQLRNDIIYYSIKNPEFLTSLEPLIPKTNSKIINLMCESSKKADVGPMASVAGAIAELNLMKLIKQNTKFSIIENGGDIALKTNKKVVIGLYSGKSPLSGNIGFQIKPQNKPIGICTSSGTVGHSISFGKSDSVTVFSKQASLSDALATSIANNAIGPNSQDMVQNCLDKSDDYREFYKGVLIVVGEHAGTIGKIPQLIKTNSKTVLGDLFEV
jgi:hypothetical protein